MWTASAEVTSVLALTSPGLFSLSLFLRFRDPNLHVPEGRAAIALQTCFLK